MIASKTLAEETEMRRNKELLRQVEKDDREILYWQGRGKREVFFKESNFQLHSRKGSVNAAVLAGAGRSLQCWAARREKS